MQRRDLAPAERAGYRMGGLAAREVANLFGELFNLLGLLKQIHGKLGRSVIFVREILQILREREQLINVLANIALILSQLGIGGLDRRRWQERPIRRRRRRNSSLLLRPTGTLTSACDDRSRRQQASPNRDNSGHESGQERTSLRVHLCGLPAVESRKTPRESEWYTSALSH